MTRNETIQVLRKNNRLYKESTESSQSVEIAGRCTAMAGDVSKTPNAKRRTRSLGPHGERVQLRGRLRVANSIPSISSAAERERSVVTKQPLYGRY